MENNENTTFGAAEQQKAEKREQTNRGWQAVTIGGVTGILLGAGGMYAVDAFAGSNTMSEAEETSSTDPSQTANETATLPVAEVDQQQSFGEAFAAARAAVGPGGVFHWHGGVYGTYYANEWNSMTPAERAQFTHQAMTEASLTTDSPTSDATVDDTAHSTATVSGTSQKPEAKPVETADVQKPEEETRAEEPEVRFLGVDRIETEDGPWNVGRMMIDNQEVAYIDMDDDLVFDVAASDTNHNDHIEADEVVDISGRGLTVTDFAIASMAQEEDNANPAQPETASMTGQDQIGEDMPDYMNDADVQTI